MEKREVIRTVLQHQRAPYVPWNVGFTQEAEAKLKEFLETDDLDQAVENHLLGLGNGVGFFDPIGVDLVRDVFGVVWDRSVDKDIGIVRGTVLSQPTLVGYTFPNPLEQRFYADIPEKLAGYGDRYRVFNIGFSLYERAWTLRGMENLMMDFIENPIFVRDLLEAIAEYNVAQVHEALRYDIDAVYFGDDWGQQRGLQMGYRRWKQHLYPVLKRMYAPVREAGKAVFIHSCGDVDEVFDDLVEIGVNCFNPFQPEVMDVFALLERYRGRLAFHGGLSTQRTLPYGTVEDVRRETRRLIEAGRNGGYIFSPAHAVEGDVPVENMLAFLDELRKQEGLPQHLKVS
jgi:uroporphyrinogen decarboxylase